MIKMKAIRRGALLTIALLIAISVPGFSLEVPPLQGRVNDGADMIGSTTERDLNNYLIALEEQTGAQIAVLTIPSLEDEVLESYSIRVVDEWQLGTTGEDNGVLLLVAAAEKKIRIEVGYGLEGTLTDAKSGYIIRNTIQPAFQRGDFDGGFRQGVQTIGGVVAGDIEITPTSSQTGGDGGRSSVGFSFNIVAFLLIIALGGLGRRGGRGRFGHALFWGMLLGGGRRHTGYRSGSSGFSSGGFGGFSGGGGGFGGGGASGGW